MEKGSRRGGFPGLFHTSRPNDWNPARLRHSSGRSVGRAYFPPERLESCPTSSFKRAFSRAGILHTSPRRGFTILFAVLIGSLLLSIGLFIAHLSLKEIVLSTAGRNSEIAFFAADTGIECALYWDFRVRGLFPSSDKGTAPTPINCNGNANTLVSVSAQSSTAATSTFTLTLLPTGCAIVLVGKTLSGLTIIESRGRNECGLAQNPARVERALRARY